MIIFNFLTYMELPFAMGGIRHDILFFWVARMIMMGIEFTGKSPFSTVYLHGLVRDPQVKHVQKRLIPHPPFLILCRQQVLFLINLIIMSSSVPCHLFSPQQNLLFLGLGIMKLSIWLWCGMSRVARCQSHLEMWWILWTQSKSMERMHCGLRLSLVVVLVR